MKFRRTTSATQNATATQARLQLKEAFKEIDKDSSGAIDQTEFQDVLKYLQIQLQDPLNDADTVFDYMDHNGNGLITCDEFLNTFDDLIHKREAVGHMDVDDVIKDTLCGILSRAREERGHVIQAFMIAGQNIEHNDEGFGKGYWGCKWKFILFDKIYAKPVVDGSLVPVKQRYSFLKEKLELIQDQKYCPWLEAMMESEERFKKEIIKHDVVRDFCKEWLRHLNELHPDRISSETPQDKAG